MAGTGLRERVLIGELWQMGMKDIQIAERLGLRQRTVRKWRQKWSRYGRVGVVSQMGRPKQGALCSFPAEIVDQLKEWREAHPGWGPKTLWAELVRHPAWDGEPLPSRASIGRWLRQAGKTRPYQKQPRLPQVLSPTRACHEEWEMDARGHEHIDEVGLVSLIQVNDLFSRVKLISYPCLVGQTHLEHYPATPDYQLVLRRAFVEWELPDRLAVDRAHVFLDVQGSTPFPTPLHLWLLGLGVQLTFGRPNQPRDQAVTERSHQTWWAQVVVGQHFSGLDGLWQALERRRSFLNEDLPCHSLGEQPPLIAFPQVRQPRRRYRPEWEEDLLDLERIYHFLSQCRWFRRSSKVGTVSMGGHNYSLGKHWYNAEVEVSFDPQTRAFVFQAPPRPEKRLPIRWLSKAGLMGELTPLACFDQVQLMLPFSGEAWRTLHLTRLFETPVS